MAGIRLPPAFNPATPASLHAYVGACLEFLSSPLVASLLECHPNDIAVGGPRSEWLPWWSWASRGRRKWHLLIPGWPLDDGEKLLASELPLELTQMLNAIDTLALPRTSASNGVSPSLPPMRGMSRKKSHEVSEMSAFVGSLISQCTSEIKHVVDVGAGQGYLSRALSEPPHSMNVLALDSSEVQTKGAERRGRNIKIKGSKIKKTGQHNAVYAQAPSTSAVVQHTSGTLTHEMIHINPRTLEDSVTNWISTTPISSQVNTPVLLVALHACGSLTPDILRCFIAGRSQTSPTSDTSRYQWYPAGLVVVGCCYNLMSEESDFPMSKLVLDEMESNKRPMLLSYNHRSLAAQSPSHWALDVSTRSAAELAIRKVVYRALLGRQTALATDFQQDSERYGKVGRLHDSAYASLELFISQFNARKGVEVPIPAWDDVQDVASCLEVLHVLRSRIGPVVESVILVDRWLYLAENLPLDNVLSVNLFDQAQGSARNVALVVHPP